MQRLLVLWIKKADKLQQQVCNWRLVFMESCRSRRIQKQVLLTRPHIHKSIQINERKQQTGKHRCNSSDSSVSVVSWNVKNSENHLMLGYNSSGVGMKSI